MNKTATTLDKDTSDKVNFMTFIIGEFANTYRMNRQQTYFYLKQFGGLEYLNRCWWALHTDNPVHAVRDINKICQMNGGTQ